MYATDGALALKQELIPVEVVNPFHRRAEVIAFPPAPHTSLPDISFAGVMESASECFGDALVSFHAGLGIIWLYFRYWLASLRSAVVIRAVRTCRATLSLAGLCALAAMGWGCALGLFAILLWS